MNIILLSKARKSPINLNIKRGTILVLAIALFAGGPILFAGLGYAVALSQLEKSEDELATSFAMIKERDEVEQVVLDAKNSINALTVRLGQLQAHAIRLDALGKRLIEISDLDQGEFDFDNPPAMGGPEDASVVETMDIPDFVAALERLSRQLEDREQQLTIIESLMIDKHLAQETVPAGRPIESGWTSSHFGKRADPFTGKRAFHYGVDFAGKEGSNVIATASGVVTWSGERYGYGRMVEIDHGNGYITRYAHNKKNLVEVGEVVKKGQALALMGSSGRSTGPHVHFEVLRNGKAVNPAKYVRAAR